MRRVLPGNPIPRCSKLTIETPDMATKKPKKPLSVEALKHDEATRKNIPTAEYQAMLAFGIPGGLDGVEGCVGP